MQSLYHYLENQIENRENLPEILDCFEELNLKTADKIVVQGEVVAHYFFVSKGGFRFTSENDGEQYTC